jgi:ATP-dependent protease ClpP protease subunit
MSTEDGDDVEILMYGDIVQERPVDWWTGEPLPGNYIALDDFLNDLNALVGAKRITLRISSCGGDAYAAIPIHNRLRELKAHVTAVVDGVAMSGASLIMCAAGTVQVNPSSLVMVHRCWSFVWGGFNADDLRRVAESNDAVDRAQAAIYARKTGMSEADCLLLMSAETYMTGREAAEKGFADEVIEDAEPAKVEASADGRALYVNGQRMQPLFALSALPDWLPTYGNMDSNMDEDNAGLDVAESTGNGPLARPSRKAAAQDADTGKGLGNGADMAKRKAAAQPTVIGFGGLGMGGVFTPAASGNAANGKQNAMNGVMKGKTLTMATQSATEETDPSDGGMGMANGGVMMADAVAAAVMAERARIKEIDRVAALYSDAAVNEAKYGQNACTAQELAYKEALAAAEKGRKKLESMLGDSMASGVEEVGAAAPPHNEPGSLTPEQITAQARMDARAAMGYTDAPGSSGQQNAARGVAV